MSTEDPATVEKTMSSESATNAAPVHGRCYVATRFDGWHDRTMVLTESELEESKRDGSFAKEDQYGGGDWRVFRIAEEIPIEKVRGDGCSHEWVDARNAVVKSGEMCPKCGAIRATIICGLEYSPSTTSEMRPSNVQA